MANSGYPKWGQDGAGEHDSDGRAAGWQQSTGVPGHSSATGRLGHAQVRNHFPAHSPHFIAALKALGAGMHDRNDQAQLMDWQVLVQELTSNKPLAESWKIEGPARLLACGAMRTGCAAEMDGGG